MFKMGGVTCVGGVVSNWRHVFVVSLNSASCLSLNSVGHTVHI